MSVACLAKKPRPRKARAFVLGDFMPYRIVSFGHAVSGGLAKAYRGENLTVPEWRVLAVVAQAESVAARDVVRQTPLDKMAVSRAVASLEQKGLMKRSPDERDRRVAPMSLSENGRALFDKIAAMALAYEEGLLSALSREERTAFEKILAKLEARADEDNIAAKE